MRLMALMLCIVSKYHTFLLYLVYPIKHLYRSMHQLDIVSFYD